MGDLSRVLPVTLRFEGGWSDATHDPGGATMKGVTQRVYDAYRRSIGKPQISVRFISDTELLAIYSEGYWRPIGGDSLPVGVDLAAFDYAVNSGVGAAKKALVAAGGLAPIPRIKAICARRLSILHGLSTWKYFGKGWGPRVNEVLATGIKWASSSPDEARKELQATAAEHTSKAVSKAHAAVAAVIPGIIAPASVVNPSAATHAALGLAGEVALGAFGVALLGGAIWVLIQSKRHADTASALSAAAKEV